MIYYAFLSRSLILLLLIYPKNEQDDLSPEQKRILRSLVASEIAARQVAE